MCHRPSGSWRRQWSFMACSVPRKDRVSKTWTHSPCETSSGVSSVGLFGLSISTSLGCGLVRQALHGGTGKHGTLVPAKPHDHGLREPDAPEAYALRQGGTLRG